MIKRIADALLIHTGHTLTALVSQSENEEILSVALFDTYWQRDCAGIHSGAAALSMISHHPEGRDAPYAQDLDNLSYFKTLSGLPVHLWIASEYFPDGVMDCT